MWVKAESHGREVTAESPWQRDIEESHEESHSKRPGADNHSRDSGLSQQRFRALTAESCNRGEAHKNDLLQCSSSAPPPLAQEPWIPCHCACCCCASSALCPFPFAHASQQAAPSHHPLVSLLPLFIASQRLHPCAPLIHPRAPPQVLRTSAGPLPATSEHYTVSPLATEPQPPSD